MDVSVAALASRPSLAAIALLLLNDHVLKATAPSIVTDKLSDFAGLFFAPYALLTVVGLLWANRLSEAAAVRLAILGFLLIGACFAAVKLSAAAARPLLEALTVALGVPTAIVQDPTDLIALVVLPASFILWRRRLRWQYVAGRGHAHAVVVCAALASMVATSQARPWVASIAVDPMDADTMYAVLASTVADGVYGTHDGGRHWARGTADKGSLFVAPAPSHQLYLLTWDSWDPRVYRLSTDGSHPVDVGPPSPGPRPHTVYVWGTNLLHAPEWSSYTIFMLRNGTLLRTTDGGSIWQSYGPGGYGVDAIATSRTPGLVFAATDEKLFRSADSGNRWTEIAPVPGRLGALALHPTDASILLAGVGNELWRSSDGGKTWQSLWHYSRGSPDLATWRILFDARDPERAYVLHGLGCCAPLMSTDAGRTWRVWGQEISDLVGGGDRDHPLLAKKSYGDGVLRLVAEPPGRWEDVGGTLPLRQ